MERKTQVAVGLLVLLAMAIALFIQFMIRSNGTEVTVVSGCTDIVDFWSGISFEDGVKECATLVGFPGDSLQHHGFRAEDCQLQDAYGESCQDIGALGTRLACVYSCEK